jgi:hypothetical protein
MRKELINFIYLLALLLITNNQFETMFNESLTLLFFN